MKSGKYFWVILLILYSFTDATFADVAISDDYHYSQGARLFQNLADIPPGKLEKLFGGDKELTLTYIEINESGGFSQPDNLPNHAKEFLKRIENIFGQIEDPVGSRRYSVLNQRLIEMKEQASRALERSPDPKTSARIRKAINAMEGFQSSYDEYGNGINTLKKVKPILSTQFKGLSDGISKITDAQQIKLYDAAIKKHEVMVAESRKQAAKPRLRGARSSSNPLIVATDSDKIKSLISNANEFEAALGGDKGLSTRQKMIFRTIHRNFEKPISRPSSFSEYGSYDKARQNLLNDGWGCGR